MLAHLNKIIRNDILQIVGSLALVLLILGALVLMRPREQLPQVDNTPNAPELGVMPLAFEPNAGQTAQEVKFLAHGGGGILFFTPSEVVLSLPLPQVSDGSDSAATAGQANVRVQFVGTSEELQVVQGSALAGKVNYYIGSDSSKWHAGLPTYGGVTYRGLYPGVDLSYSGTGTRLKGTYSVAPGADPGAIRWRYAGVGQASVDESGTLRLQAAGSDLLKLSEQAPVAWQEIDGRRLVVMASYTEGPDGTFGFSVGGYNSAYPLVIDPTLIYSTYLGGSANEGVRAVAERPDSFASRDNAALVMGGYTLSTDFPTASPYQPNNAGGRDAFVSMLDPRGPGWYFSTYLGGSGDDVANGVAAVPAGFGSHGDILVTGVTTSTNFPTLLPYQPNNAGGQDAFMALLSTENAYQLTNSTYFGGSGDDVAYAAAFARGSGNCCELPAPYFAGSTTSTDFPIVLPYQPLNAGGQDAFLVHFPYDLQLPDYSTYLGGSGDDAAYGLSVSVSGEPYLTGSTNSTDFPRQSAYQMQYGGGSSDAFLTHFAYGATSLQFSTYLGGSGADRGNSIAVDGQGDCYATGATDSANFPTYMPYQPGLAGGQDAFVTKMHQYGTSLGYSTYLGGSTDDEGKGIAVDAAGFSYMTGWTDSANFPTVNAVQPNSAGGRDAFVTKLELDGSEPVYSTYLGGSAADLGIAVAVQTQEPGVAYVGGQTGSGDYPTVNPMQPNNAGGDDALISTIYDRCGPYQNYEITQTTGVSLVPGTVDTGNHCDSCRTTINLPFTFHLYDASTTTLDVNDDGLVDYGIMSNPSSYNFCLPVNGWPWLEGYAIMPHFDDLHTDCAGCGIFTSVTGQAPDRIFNVEWRAQRVAGGAVNFEARLYEGTESRFDFVYGSVAGSGDSATIGTQKKRGFLYTEYSCNQPSLSSGLQLTFTQPACPEGPQVTSTPTNTVTGTPPTSTNTPSNTPTSLATATPTSTMLPSPPGPPCPASYADLSPNDPDFAYAHCATCSEILETFACGYNQGEPCIPPDNYPYFRPAVGFVGTRGEVTLSVSNAAGFQDTPQGQQFQDIPIGSTYYPYVYRLAARGIEVGFACGGVGEPCVPPANLPYYRPYVVAVRGEFARFVSNTAGFNDPPGDQLFQDVLPGNPYYEYVWRVASRGLMQGFACGGPGEPCIPPNNLPYFRPDTLLSTVSRSEIAHILVSTFLPSCPLTTPTPSPTPTVTLTDTPTTTNTPTSALTNTPTYTPTVTPTQTSAGHTATATPTVQPTVCTLTFTDVPIGSTFYPYIHCLACLGIISGYPDGSFKPNNNVTRGQLAKIVSNSAGFNDPQSTQRFQDVPVSSTFFQYIGRLASRGYMSGYACGGAGEQCVPPANLPYFRPNNKATRGQLTKIVSNAAGFQDNIPTSVQSFADVLPNSTFWVYVERLLLNRPGVMGGYPCGGANEPCDPQQRPYFRPGNNVTRGQTSKIVANTFFPGCQSPSTRK